mmetsp:Transcript_145941/g.254638  ORF Transcript_145941/g.254638 Transcript_145941/m.254638 type:complete len:200 (-) Transcript_145941:91-690(-)
MLQARKPDLSHLKVTRLIHCHELLCKGQRNEQRRKHVTEPPCNTGAIPIHQLMLLCGPSAIRRCICTLWQSCSLVHHFTYACFGHLLHVKCLEFLQRLLEVQKWHLGPQARRCFQQLHTAPEMLPGSGASAGDCARSDDWGCDHWCRRRWGRLGPHFRPFAFFREVSWSLTLPCVRVHIDVSLHLHIRWRAASSVAPYV